MAVFPARQGGPHNHQIVALGPQLLEVYTPEFVEHSKDVVSNAGTLAEALIAKGHKLASGGTDNHLVLWVLRPHGLGVQGREGLSPGGVRIARAMITRACTTEDFKVIADFLHRCSSIALELGVGLKFRRDRRGKPQVLQVYFAAMWDSLVVPAPCDCSSAIKPSPTLRSRSLCASWAPSLIGGLCGDHSPHRTTMIRTKCCPIFKFGSWWRLTVHLLVFYGGEHFLSMLLSANAIFAESSRRLFDDRRIRCFVSSVQKFF